MSQRSPCQCGLEAIAIGMDPCCRERLEVPSEQLWDADYSGRRLHVLVDGLNEAVSVWRQLGVPQKQSRKYAVKLLDALEMRRNVLTRDRKLVAFTEPHEMVESLMESNRGRLQMRERQISEMLIIPMKKTDQVQWRTFRQLKLLRAGKMGKSRKQVEEEERIRWVKAVITVIVEAHLPFCDQANETMEPEKALMRCCGRRRGSTIRARYRAWVLVGWWLITIYGITWPRKPAYMMSCLECRASEPCARSVPGQVAGALSFMEKVGAVPEDMRISSHDAWLATMSDVTLQLQEATVDLEVNKSPVYFAMMPVALELEVMDDRRPLYKRFLAWVLAVRIWISARGDDAQGIPPHKLRLKPLGMIGEMDRSKTTGPGKKVRRRPIVVSHSATLSGKPWLTEGFNISANMGEALTDRDYLVPLPTEDYQGFQPMAADYAQQSALVLALTSSLRFPVLGEGGWSFSNDNLLTYARSAKSWRLHSARSVMSTWCFSLGVENRRRVLWAAGGRSRARSM